MDLQSKPKLWARFGSWIKHHKIILLSAFGVILIGSASALAFTLFYKAPVETNTTESTTTVEEITEPAPEPVKYYSTLTGRLVDSEAVSKQAVTAIMIENSPSARPQSGLKDSGVVFEAIAEGGITRFIALYQEQKPTLIGPVRSVRMYYVEWAAAFNASIAHIGGSAAALKEVRNGKYRDIDQFFNSASYWRATDRAAPHNVYTSFERLDALNKKKGYETSSFTGFTRTDALPVETPNASNIKVTISSAAYASSYIYDPATNTYARSVGGAKHLDREQGQISPSSVIVMKVNESTVFEDGYRQSIQTVGSGKAFIFQNGTVIQGTWKKNSKTEQITFTDAAGADIPLVRGQTWITAVPNNKADPTWN